MTAIDYAGIAVVVVIWTAIILLLCRMLGFNGLDDGDERDPYA